MYLKLIVDGKTVYVFESDKIPNWINRLLNMTGVNFEDAEEVDRMPYRQLEHKLERDRRLKRENEKHT
jgi:hypothetical protein